MRQKDPFASLCLRPNLRDSLRPAASGCPFGVRRSPYFPKRRPSPIFLPESFCVPLRRRLSGLSRSLHPTVIPFFRRPGTAGRAVKICLVSVWFSCSLSISSPPRHCQAAFIIIVFRTWLPVFARTRGPAGLSLRDSAHTVVAIRSFLKCRFYLTLRGNRGIFMIQRYQNPADYSIRRRNRI